MTSQVMSQLFLSQTKILVQNTCYHYCITMSNNTLGHSHHWQLLDRNMSDRKFLYLLVFTLVKSSLVSKNKSATPKHHPLLFSRKIVFKLKSNEASKIVMSGRLLFSRVIFIILGDRLPGVAVERDHHSLREWIFIVQCSRHPWRNASLVVC